MAEEPDDTCDNDIGPTCRVLYPESSASWCEGCLHTALADATRQLAAMTTERDVARAVFCEAHQPSRASCPCCEAVHADNERRKAEQQLAALRAALEQLPRFIAEIHSGDREPSMQVKVITWHSVRALFTAPPQEPE